MEVNGFLFRLENGLAMKSEEINGREPDYGSEFIEDIRVTLLECGWRNGDERYMLMIDWIVGTKYESELKILRWYFIYNPVEEMAVVKETKPIIKKYDETTKIVIYKEIYLRADKKYKKCKEYRFEVK